MNTDKSLENWRKQIDALDVKLLNILAERINVVKAIGKYKKEHGIQPLDQKRWQEVMQSKFAKARSLGISVKFIKNLYNLIHEYSLEIENKS